MSEDLTFAKPKCNLWLPEKSAKCNCLVVVEAQRNSEGWGVRFSVGGRPSFEVGPQNYEEKEDADWMAKMFMKALSKIPFTTLMGWRLSSEERNEG